MRRHLPVAIAVAVHAVVLALLPRGRGRAPSPLPAGDVVVDLEDVPVERGPEDARALLAKSEKPIEVPLGRRVAATRVERTAEGVPSPEGDGAGDRAPSDWTFAPGPVAKGGVDLGLGGHIPANGGGGGDGRGERGLSERTNHALGDALAAGDLARGVTRAGPIVIATENVVRREISPVVGDAQFEAVFDAHGAIQSVRVTSCEKRAALAESIASATAPLGQGIACDADKRTWDEIADAITKELAKKPARVPPLAKGLVVAFAVESRWRHASGHDDAIAIGIDGVPLVQRGRGDKPIELFLNFVPKGNGGTKDPAMFGGGTNLDPTDLARKPQRQVRARILSETPL